MKTVMFKNDNAMFDFELPDVINRLKYYSDQKVREATEILEAISSCRLQPSKSNQTILVT